MGFKLWFKLPVGTAHAPCTTITKTYEWTGGPSISSRGDRFGGRKDQEESRYTVCCTIMSKPHFQTEWEEIDKEYQQLQVTGMFQTSAVKRWVAVTASSCSVWVTLTDTRVALAHLCLCC